MVVALTNGLFNKEKQIAFKSSACQLVNVLALPVQGPSTRIYVKIEKELISVTVATLLFSAFTKHKKHVQSSWAELA